MPEDQFILRTDDLPEGVVIEIFERAPGLLDFTSDVENRHNARVDSLVDGLQGSLRSVPAVVAALDGGHLVRLVGPADLLTGVDSGAFHLVRTSQGLITTVANSKGVFQGPLRVEHVPRLTSVSLAVFQVASAVTLQYYLHRINSELEVIKARVDSIEERMQSEFYGRLAAVRHGLRRYDDMQRGGVAADLRELISLQDGLDITNAVFESSLQNLAEFRRKVTTARSELEALGREDGEREVAKRHNEEVKKIAKGMMRPEPSRPRVGKTKKAVKQAQAMTSTAERDLYLLLDAARLNLQLHERLVASGSDSARTQAAREHAAREFEQLDGALQQLQSDLRLPVLPGERDVLTRNARRPAKNSDEIRQLRRDCSAFVRAIERTEEALVAFERPNAFVVELVRGSDGVLRARGEPVTPAVEAAS